MSDMTLESPRDYKGRVPQVDPCNPWPRGSEWWHRHNEAYRRDKAMRFFNEQMAKTAPERGQ